MTSIHARLAARAAAATAQSCALTGAAAGVSAAASWPKISQKKCKLQQQGDGHLLLMPGALSSAEATGFVAAAEALGFRHQSSRGAAHGEAFRDNDRLSVDDPALAERLWAATNLAACFSGREYAGCRAVGLNNNIRIYRYRKGQRFGKHIDESVDLGSGRFTVYTLLIYLSICGGGETIFYDGRRRVAAVQPQPGLALLHLAPPEWLGPEDDECLEHEGAAVTEGTKYVLSDGDRASPADTCQPSRQWTNEVLL